MVSYSQFQNIEYVWFYLPNHSVVVWQLFFHILTDLLHHFVVVAVAAVVVVAAAVVAAAVVPVAGIGPAEQPERQTAEPGTERTDRSAPNTSCCRRVGLNNGEE